MNKSGQVAAEMNGTAHETSSSTSCDYWDEFARLLLKVDAEHSGCGEQMDVLEAGRSEVVPLSVPQKPTAHAHCLLFLLSDGHMAYDLVSAETTWLFITVINVRNVYQWLDNRG